MKVHISISEQRLSCGEQSYPISSGKAGTGSEEGSGKTPLGRFRIASKHGSNAPSNTIFVGRLPIGLYPDELPAGAKEGILARILTLDGLDASNANTMARYIYIHGTSDEAHIGQPASLGCIRMRPPDIIELYDQLALGDEVSIEFF
ncbi:MAG: L,D-transpeptidase [Akkermansia sp.]